MQKSVEYRGIRYAQAGRFGTASQLPASALDASRPRGPIPPQLPSRLENVLGPQAELEQSEDCQVLSVFTPDTSGKRPVIVWFHGGAFVTGGGELPWYDGKQFSEEQDIVVVSVSYRLGLLGYLRMRDTDTPSPATSDQFAALDWIHANIQSYGGDPNNLTLAGHSAGAASINALLRWGVGDYVSGVILQSGFLSDPHIYTSRETANQQLETATELCSTALMDAEVDELLELQARMWRESGMPTYWAPTLPRTSRDISVPLLAGDTEHDSLPFLLLAEGRTFPNADDFAAGMPRLVELNRNSIVEGNRRAAQEAHEQGKRSWLYTFSVQFPSSGWGAPHGIELPLLFGSEKAWSEAPMIEGSNWEDVQLVGRQVRHAWAQFARDKDPGGWVEYGPDRPWKTVIEGKIS